MASRSRSSKSSGSASSGSRTSSAPLSSDTSSVGASLLSDLPPEAVMDSAIARCRSSSSSTVVPTSFESLTVVSCAVAAALFSLSFCRSCLSFRSLSSFQRRQSSIVPALRCLASANLFSAASKAAWRLAGLLPANSNSWACAFAELFSAIELLPENIASALLFTSTSEFLAEFSDDSACADIEERFDDASDAAETNCKFSGLISFGWPCTSTRMRSLDLDQVSVTSKTRPI
mmetsp:Transcript_51493/g.92493  ORF Transcript_51493/g.92493 Transcript_51493/m.92493 type:complete len:232 (+) Transcript_51493:810-1505(+)